MPSSVITIAVNCVMPSRLLYHMEHKSTSKRYGKLSAEGFARGDAVVIRGVLDGKAVAYELGARIARALSPGLHPGTATMIIISHQERIISLADEVIVVGDGTIRHRGSAADILPQILADTLGTCPVLTKGGDAQ